MKHIFIVNLMSGNGKRHQSLIDDINRICDERKLDYEVRLTEYPLHAKEIVKTVLADNTDVRFYACGGDGTVNEVACGIVECGCGELAVIPIGTGNDFVRSFAPDGDYMSLENQLSGKSVKIDAVSVGTDFFVNILNVGFDSAVVRTIANLRNKSSIMRGKFAYIIGLIINLFKMPKTTLRCEFDDGDIVEGKFLLSAFSNGRFYGGGFQPAANAELDDGMLDILFVRPCSRMTFLSLVGKYKKGTLMGCKRAEKYVVSKKCKSLKVTFSPESSVCVDGEMTDVHSFDMKVLPLSLALSLPCKERSFELCEIH